MAGRSSNAIIITEGNWMHIPHVLAIHRHFPEARGEGLTPCEAAGRLKHQLDRALDCAQGCDREPIERAIAEVRAFVDLRPRHGARAAASAP